MTSEHAPVLEFPAMLHGPLATVRREVSAQSRRWAREYLKTGAFSPPRRMSQVLPGEVLVVRSGAEFGAPHACWRVHMFISTFTLLHLHEGVPKEVRQRMEDAFETFCLSTPWGTLYHAASLPPPWDARHTSNRLAAVLRFWEVLQGPRYAFWSFMEEETLGELMDNIYRMTLEAWCPGARLPSASTWR